MGKKTPQAPTPPDPVKTAAAQGAINKDTAITQANLNRFDEYTPYGTSTWSQQGGTPGTGGTVGTPGTPASREPIYSKDTWVDAYEEEHGDGETRLVPGYMKRGGQITGYRDIAATPGTPGVADPNDPTQRWTRTTTLDPEQQALFDKQTAVSNELNQTALDQVGRVGDALSTPFSYEGISPAGSTAGARSAAGRVADISNTQYDYSGQPAAPSARGITDSADIAARSVSTPFGLQGRAPGTAGISGAADRAEAGMAQRFNYDGLPAGSTAAGSEAAVQRTTDAYGTPLNYAGAPAAPGADAAARNQVIDSVYGQFRSRLDPKFEGELIQKETQLANSGIARGSAAFSGAMDDFYRGRNDAYQGAQNAAIQAGGAEQSRLFGLGSTARRDAISEQNYLRASTGREQDQILGQQGQLASLQDRIRGRGAQERLAEREVGLNESERLQALRGRQFTAEGAARDRSVQEQLIERDKPMEEQAQLQAMRRAAFDAQGQERSRGIGEQDSLRNRALTEQQANYNMQAGLFGLDQGARQRAIEESAYLRNMPLNETSALMSGNQIMNPSFGAAPNTAIANTDYSGLVQNQYAGQQNQYNQQVASNNSKRAAFASMAGTLGKAYMGMP
jgi:hypothetical protein